MPTVLTPVLVTAPRYPLSVGAPPSIVAATVLRAMSDAAAPRDEVAISVLVVTYNNRDLIGRCLDAIFASDGAGAVQVIVIDNASADGTLEHVAAGPWPVEALALDRNVGFAKAVNAGFERARGEYVALVNSDAFVDPRCLGALARALAERPRAGIVGACLRYPSGRHQPSAGTFPSLLGGLWVALFLHRLPGLSRAGIGYLANPALYRRARRVDWVSAAVCAARAELGPLPDSHFMYGEDVEWGAAARAADWEVWLEPDATAVHVSAASVADSQATGFAQRRRAQFELEWFARRGALAKILARAVLVLHGLARVLLYGAGGLVRGRRDGRVREYIALLRAALSTRTRAA
jgi:N-acetylglucosaminyl-diphospho-decaprenol L-rhamnosyltransferase